MCYKKAMFRKKTLHKCSFSGSIILNYYTSSAISSYEYIGNTFVNISVPTYGTTLLGTKSS